MPGQIEVDFADGSWAAVPIQSDFSLERVDEEVSKYDPEFFQVNLNAPNPLVSVGLQRSSRQPVAAPEPLVQYSAVPPQDFRTQSGFTPYVLAMSQYLAENGNTRLKDVIDAICKSDAENPNFDVENLVSSVTYQAEQEIYDQALSELENGV